MPWTRGCAQNQLEFGKTASPRRGKGVKHLQRRRFSVCYVAFISGSVAWHALRYSWSTKSTSGRATRRTSAYSARAIAAEYWSRMDLHRAPGSNPESSG